MTGKQVPSFVALDLHSKPAGPVAGKWEMWVVPSFSFIDLATATKYSDLKLRKQTEA